MKELRKILAKTFRIRPSKINDNASPENIKTWDSFHGLLLVTELENHYKVKFTIDDVVSVKNVGDIKKTLRRYGIKIDER